MEQFSNSLDHIFQALADPTRRAVLERLGHGPASVGELAMPFDMALPSFMKHITMLEASGLIRTHKRGRVRHCSIEPQRLALIDGWLADQRALWTGRTDRLERFVTQPGHKDKPR
ncbi:metalloregulator ArsR/SmtB family transcription factor [Devosia sp. FKR38]|uniref:ArsR/SmtB family transcription factor n=1 Tax=Devosia sp. FKR38 TaxID=2562312 RepID=UPI0010C08451|nr:metalloregulator ArsR/SmtB family transcription factor [Devosia sp. FKR38]